MARVEVFEEVSKDRPQVHDPIRCGYFAFVAEDGARYLTLETYGSSAREMPDKISQSFQLDERAAARLLDLIRKTFPNLR